MIRLITQHYLDPNAARQEELDFCLHANLEHPHITQLVLHTPKTVQDRASFTQLLHLARALSGPNDINIIANSDIFFDETLIQCEAIKQNEMYALGRWDVGEKERNKFENNCSQDSWFFRGPPRDFPCDFYLGYPGCDNRFSWEARQVGYDVYNPAQTIRAWHLHASSVRRYTDAMRLHGNYLFVDRVALAKQPNYEAFYHTATG